MKYSRFLWLVMMSIREAGPNFEGFKDCEQLLVVYVVVELWGGEGPGVKSNRVDFGIIQRCDRENGGEGIVRGDGFEDDLCIWDPMG